MGARTNGVCVLKISRGVALDQFLRNCITGEGQVYTDKWSKKKRTDHEHVHRLPVQHQGPR